MLVLFRFDEVMVFKFMLWCLVAGGEGESSYSVEERIIIYAFLARSDTLRGPFVGKSVHRCAISGRLAAHYNTKFASSN